MKRIYFLVVASLLIGGCAEKPLATSVVELAGNIKVVGWDDEENETKNIKVVTKNGCKIPKDSDGDGVIDRLDKCPNTPRNVLVNHYGCPIITTLRINFDFDKANIKKIYYPEIEKIAIAMKNNPKLKIEIDGYTDNIGNEKYNLKLSLKRAQRVKDILVKKYGIDPKRMVVKGFGEKYPLLPNTTSTNRALNRRVEIIDITNSI
ncbi:MAG TPA: OmpA family protein [Nautiliaceae bacterium]|nr:OmpA family protein [Nautiliaceae bacterium]